MSLLAAVVRAVTLRDLSDQIAESKKKIEEAEKTLREQPPEKVRKVLIGSGASSSSD